MWDVATIVHSSLKPLCEWSMWMFTEGQKAVSKRQPRECRLRDTKRSQEAEKFVASEYTLNDQFHEKGQSSNST